MGEFGFLGTVVANEGFEDLAYAPVSRERGGWMELVGDWGLPAHHPQFSVKCVLYAGFLSSDRRLSWNGLENLKGIWLSALSLFFLKRCVFAYFIYCKKSKEG